MPWHHQGTAAPQMMVQWPTVRHTKVRGEQWPPASQRLASQRLSGRHRYHRSNSGGSGFVQQPRCPAVTVTGGSSRDTDEAKLSARLRACSKHKPNSDDVSDTSAVCQPARDSGRRVHLVEHIRRGIRGYHTPCLTAG